MRHETPPSSVIYDPVMSQYTRTREELCGLMVGKNIVPPPPGPTISHRSCRAAAAVSMLPIANPAITARHRITVDIVTSCGAAREREEHRRAAYRRSLNFGVVVSFCSAGAF